MNILVFAVSFLLFTLLYNGFLFVISFILSKKIKKKYPLLYIIGYKNGVAILGARSDSWVDAVGFVPVAKAKVEVGTVKSCGWVTYDLKPRFNLSDSIPYNVKIVQYVQK